MTLHHEIEPGTLEFYKPHGDGPVDYAGPGTIVHTYRTPLGRTMVGIAGDGPLVSDYPVFEGRPLPFGPGDLSPAEVAALKHALGAEVDPKLLEQLPAAVVSNPLTLVELPHVIGSETLFADAPAEPTAADSRAAVRSVVQEPTGTEPDGKTPGKTEGWNSADEWRPLTGGRPPVGGKLALKTTAAVGAVVATALAAAHGVPLQGLELFAGNPTGLQPNATAGQAPSAKQPGAKPDTTPSASPSNSKTPAAPAAPQAPANNPNAAPFVSYEQNHYPDHGPGCIEAKDITAVKFDGAKLHTPPANTNVKLTVYVEKNGNWAPVAETLNPEQLKNASAIVQTGLNMKMSPWEITIALSTAWQESTFHNYTSPKYPITKTAPGAHVLKTGNNDSVGLFQQRPTSGWGASSTQADGLNDRATRLMNPTTAATLFYNSLKTKDPNSKCLTDAAQAVQHSGFGDRYAKWGPAAAQLAEMYATGKWTDSSQNLQHATVAAFQPGKIVLNPKAYPSNQNELDTDSVKGNSVRLPNGTTVAATSLTYAERLQAVQGWLNKVQLSAADYNKFVGNVVDMTHTIPKKYSNFNGKEPDLGTPILPTSPNYKRGEDNAVDFFANHYTATCRTSSISPDDLAKSMQNGGRSIGIQYVITGNGTTAHLTPYFAYQVLGYNDQSEGVEVVGCEQADITNTEYESLVYLDTYFLTQNGFITKNMTTVQMEHVVDQVLRGHRELNPSGHEDFPAMVMDQIRAMVKYQLGQLGYGDKHPAAAPSVAPTTPAAPSAPAPTPSQSPKPSATPTITIPPRPDSQPHATKAPDAIPSGGPLPVAEQNSGPTTLAQVARAAVAAAA